jgi:hypothetical protein
MKENLNENENILVVRCELGGMGDRKRPGGSRVRRGAGRPVEATICQGTTACGEGASVTTRYQQRLGLAMVEPVVWGRSRQPHKLLLAKVATPLQPS